MEQVQGYQKNHWDPGKKWALALHGGGRTPILIAVPIDDFIRLTKQVHEDSNITDLLLKNRDVIVKLAKYLENWDNEPAGSNGVGQAGGDVEDIPD